MTRICVVDDDAAVLAVLQRQLLALQLGLEVECASDGAEALRIARRQDLALLITDILMPGKDGIETIMAFRREYPAVKLIAISGGGARLDGEPLRWARLLGAEATLQKPVELEALRATVTRVLGVPEEPRQ